MVDLYRRRFEHYGHGPADQAIVGLGGQVFMRADSQDAIREFRPYFDHAPVYGGGPSLEDYMAQTPLTVGSPQQVIDRTLGFREFVGDYQRQLFLVDHAGLPLKVVLEQLDLLGDAVVPVLRREFAALQARPVPDAPTHASLQGGSRGGRAGRRPTSRPQSPRPRPTARRRAADRRRDRSSSSRPASASRRRRACSPTGWRQRPTPPRATPASTPATRSIELRDHAHDLDEQPADRLPEPGPAGGDRPVCAADGLIAVSPIFNASYSGLFKMFFDVLERDALAACPCSSPRPAARPAIRSRSTTRCGRCSPTWRAVVPTAVFAAAEDWGRPAIADGGLADRIDRAGRELAAAMAAMPRTPVVDPFDAPPDFASLLADVSGPDRGPAADPPAQRAAPGRNCRAVVGDRTQPGIDVRCWRRSGHAGRAVTVAAALTGRTWPS